MSRTKPMTVVLEWSPNGVLVFEPATRKLTRGSSVVEVAALLGLREAVFAVSRRACFVRSVVVPNAPKSDVVQALALSISQHVPIAPSEACYDVRLTSESSPQGRIATLVAMRASELRLLHDQARAAGVRVAGVVPVAVGSWLLGRAHSTGSLAVVGEGVESLSIDVLAGGELRHSRSLAPDVPLDTLDGEVCRTFSAAGVPCGPTLAAGITLEDAEYRTESTPLMALADPAWAQFGIALELPEALEERARASRSAKVRATVLLCVAAGLLGTLVGVDRADAQGAVNRRMAQKATSIRKLKAARDALSAEATALGSVQKALDRGFNPAQKPTDVIAVINNAVPPNVWLTGVNFERGKSLLIRGAAFSNDTVSQYLDTLSKEERLRDVRLIFANNALIESTPVVQFSISAFPVGNLPLAEERNGKAAR